MNDSTDLFAIAQLIVAERHWRDVGQWELMKAAYHPQSVVRVSWFQGSGFEFVEASKSLYRQGQSKHRLSPPMVRLHGDRAVAETDAIIEIRIRLGEIEVDTSANCRLLSRVRRDEGIWRLASLDAIYEKDMLVPVNPSDQLSISPEELGRYRPSYRFLCYTLQRGGREREIVPDLPGDDRPELVAALYAEAEDWLQKDR